MGYRCGDRRCTNPDHLFPIAEEPVAERFWSKVAKGDGCWEWQGARQATGRMGYGTIRIGGRLARAHRVAFELTHGPIGKGLFICHTCDNPKCVRPDHLYAGTPADNARDVTVRGRRPAPMRRG